MSGTMQSLFGGSSASSAPTDATPQDTAALRNSFTTALQSILGGGTAGAGVNPTSGPSSAALAAGANQVAPITSTETGDLASTNAQANNPNVNNYLNDEVSGAYLPGGSQADPNLQKAIQAAQTTTLQGLHETLSQSLPSQFAAAGQNTSAGSSSAFDRAGALATGQTANALGNIASSITEPAYEAERTNQNQAVALNQNQVQTSINNLAAQSLPRLISQAGLSAGTTQYQQNITNLLQALGVSTGASGLTNIANNSNSSSSTGAVNDLLAPLKLTGNLNA